MTDLEYLVGHGRRGGFGRFRADAGPVWPRGQHVVIETDRGLEMGQVLRPAGPLARLVPGEQVGRLLRPASAEDLRRGRELEGRGLEVLHRAAQLNERLGLPLEILDVEMLLDGERAALHFLSWEPCDLRPLVSTLSRQTELRILLEDLTRTDLPSHEEEGCGSCGSGGCGSGGCGSGGCGSGGCSSGMKPAELQAYFAQLREQMERRTSLL